MLTPIEIQGKTFKNSGMGYSKADVDSFFSTISSDYEALYKENLSLKEKINNLNASLDHYKEIEKSLRKHLFWRRQQQKKQSLVPRRMRQLLSRRLS